MARKRKSKRQKRESQKKKKALKLLKKAGILSGRYARKRGERETRSLIKGIRKHVKKQLRSKRQNRGFAFGGPGGLG